METKLKHFEKILDSKAKKFGQRIKMKRLTMSARLPEGQPPYVWPCYEIEKYNEFQSEKKLKLQDNISEDGMVRNVQADGNCFYKAVLFKYFQNLCHHSQKEDKQQLKVFIINIFASRAALNDVKGVDKIIAVLEVIYYYIDVCQLNLAFHIFALNFAGDSIFSDGIITIFRKRLVQFIEHLNTTNKELYLEILNYDTLENLKKITLFSNEYAQGVIIILVSQFLKQSLQICIIDQHGKFKIIQQSGKGEWPNCCLLLSNQHYFLLYQFEQIQHTSKKHFMQTEQILKQIQLKGKTQLELDVQNQIQDEVELPEDVSEVYTQLLRAPQQTAKSNIINEIYMEEEQKKITDDKLEEQKEITDEHGLPHLSAKQQQTYKEVKKYFQKMHWLIEYQQIQIKTIHLFKELRELFRRKGPKCQNFLSELEFLQKEIKQRINKNPLDGCGHQLNSLRQGLDLELIVQRNMSAQRCPICEASYFDPGKNKMQKEISKSALEEKEFYYYDCCQTVIDQKHLEIVFQNNHKFYSYGGGYVLGPFCPICTKVFDPQKIPFQFKCQLQMIKQENQSLLQSYNKAIKKIGNCELCLENPINAKTIKSNCIHHHFHLQCIMKYAKIYPSFIKDAKIFCPICIKEAAFYICQKCNQLDTARFQRCYYCKKRFCLNCNYRHILLCGSRKLNIRT